MFLGSITRGRRTTVASLYRKHGALVLRRARQILGDPDEAEDVLQAIFAKLVEQPDSIERARSETAWLYGATTHMCLNRIRNRKNRTRLLQEKVAPVERASSGPEPLALARQALERLPQELATVFVYYYLDQMTHAEIADVVGCSRRQVGNLLERAHAGLDEAVRAETGTDHE